MLCRMRTMVVLVAVICLSSQVAMSEIRESGTAERPETQSSVWSTAGYGVLCVATNILYMPAKIVYAGLGSITGGLAWLLTAGDTDTAMSIWSPSVGGTYVVSPAMLRDEEPILFSGRSYSKQ
jgi:hypothetical protein